MITILFAVCLLIAIALMAVVDAGTLAQVRQVLEPGLLEIKEGIEEMESEQKSLKKELESEKQARSAHEKVTSDLQQRMGHFARALTSRGDRPVLRASEVVSEECARHLGAVLILSGMAQGKIQQLDNAPALVAQAESVMRAFPREQRTALTTSDIPLPTEYGREVVELMWKFGQARQYATVYPLGTGTVKLPKIKTSPAFGFIDMSAVVPEKSPQIEFVDFVAKKAGGLIRVPSEIEADSIVAIGQFLARYAAREFAKWEDTVLFNADGSSTYKSISGVCKTADTLGRKIQLDPAETAPSNIGLADLRGLRAKVASAALASSAYYMNLTHESYLTSFNTVTNGQVFTWTNGQARLDGFPIRWVDVLPVFDHDAHAGQYQVAFGDLSYWYFGERGTPDIQTSRDVFFATDEIAIRALERFDCGLMADAAMAVLQLAAA